MPPGTPNQHTSLFFCCMSWCANFEFRGTQIVVMVVFELVLLMYTAVRSAMRVSWALDFRLVPLNEDRAFVADSLVRAAFELGNSNETIMGVDPGNQQDGSSKMQDVFAVAMYKGKVVLTGTVIKKIVAALSPASFSIWAKPWMGTVGAAFLWDTLICHVIMRQAELRGVGICTSIEVFNEIIELYCPAFGAVSFNCRVQMVRAVGVAIVKNGSMFPTVRRPAICDESFNLKHLYRFLRTHIRSRVFQMELLLRHAINYTGLKRHAVVQQAGTLDNEDLFVAQMAELTMEESQAVLSVHLLAHMLDGSVGKDYVRPGKLWNNLVDDYAERFSSDPNQPAGEFDPSTIHYVCQLFRSCVPIGASHLRACFDPAERLVVPASAKFNQTAHWFLEILTF